VRSARRGALLAPLAAALLLAGCTAQVTDGHGRAAPGTPPAHHSPSVTAPAPSQPLAHFTDCSDRINTGALNLPADRLGKLSFDCAVISVPLDYADPGGRQIQLALVRIHDSDNHAHTGSLIVNPGGPGGSGLDLALGLAGQVSDQILTHFDLVGFDPRGVGESTPIHCMSDSEKDRDNAASPDIRTVAGFAQAKRMAAQIAHDCEQAYGSALADFDTVQTARDLDQIRQAVGDRQMNYLGFSYGTELGAQYAHLFPSRIRVAVLDGAVDPLTSDITAFADQLRGFELAFDQFAAWCRQHSPCSGLGDPRQAVYGLVAKARRAPIPSSTPGETRTATSSIVLTGVLSALYSQSRWPTLGRALLDAQQGDSSGLFQLADDYNERFNGHYTNIADANTTISCNDSKPGPSDATIRATTRSWVQRFPMFGLWAAASLFSCQQWQPDRTVPPKPTAPTAAHRILVIGNLHDPATPYRGAQDLTNTLGNAELLTWDGEGHTSYLEGSSCIDHYVDRYLVTGALPPPDTTCPR
jgi:pimeloyl-ACP methyl ester carboxylesterase